MIQKTKQNKTHLGFTFHCATNWIGYTIGQDSFIFSLPSLQYPLQHFPPFSQVINFRSMPRLTQAPPLVFRYLSEFLYAWLMSTLSRADSSQMAEERILEEQQQKGRSSKKSKKKKKGTPHSHCTMLKRNNLKSMHCPHRFLIKSPVVWSKQYICKENN